MLFIMSAWRFVENSACSIRFKQAWTIFITVLTGRHHFCIQNRMNGCRGRQVRTWRIYTELSEIECRDLKQGWTSQDRRVLQEINSCLHRSFNLISCKIKIDEGQYQHNSQRGISQATVISAPTDTQPTFRTGVICGEVGRWELRKSISVLPMMSDRGLRLTQTSGDR